MFSFDRLRQHNNKTNDDKEVNDCPCFQAGSLLIET